MNKKILGAIVAVVLLVAVYLYASPYIMLNNLKTAVQENDSNKVSTYINFASVRQNLKDQMNGYLMKQMSASKSNDGMEALGSMFAMTMVEKVVDMAVTPEGVTLMMQGKKPNVGLDDQKTDQTDNSSSSAPSKEYSTRYLSMNQFEVSIATEEKDKTVTAILERDGLSWKVAKINIPMDKK